MNEKIIRGIIYLRTSSSGKYYIGQTIDEDKRNRCWKDMNSPYTSKNSKIDRARAKYGPDNFSYKVLLEVKSFNRDLILNILSSSEIFYIELYESTINGYNVTPGGRTYSGSGKTSTKNVPVIQLTMEGKFLREWESPLIASKELYNNKKYSSRIFRCCRHERISVKGFRWMYKEEYDSLQDKSILLTDNEDYQKVIQLNLDGEFVKEWESATEAAKMVLGNSRMTSAIYKVCDLSNFSRSTAGGFRWLYKGDYTKYKSGEIKLKDSSKESRDKRRKSVIQFDDSGNFIKEWNNLSEIENKLGISESNVQSACLNSIRAGGYRWKYKDDWDGNNLDPISRRYTKGKIILQLTIEGKLVKEFNSLSEASNELKCRGYNISNAIKEKFIYENSIWIYKDDLDSFNLSEYSNKPDRFHTSILQFDKDLNLIKEWRSVKDIENYYNKFNCISNILRQNKYEYDDYIWIRKRDFISKKDLLNKINYKDRIVKLDINGNFIEIFSSIKEAKLSKIYNSLISKDKVIVYRGFKWMREKDYLELQNNSKET